MSSYRRIMLETSTAGADPLTDAIVREHLRLPSEQDVGILGVYVPASLAYAERYAARALSPRENTGRTLDLDAWPSGLEVFTDPPTFTACTYTDADDAPQSVPVGDFDPWYDRRARCWRLEYVGAEITSYKAGTPVRLEWSALVDGAEAVDQARLMMIGHWYEHTEAVVDGPAVEVPIGTHALLDVFADVPL